MSESSSSPTEVRRCSVSATRPRRRVWVRILLSLVIFVSGGVAGTGVTLIAVRNRALYMIHHPDKTPTLIAGRIGRSLRLSDAQVQQVETILGQRQRAIQGIRREFQPRVERELDRVEEEISQVLDDEQRARWRKHFERLRSTWVPALPEP